jgi:hypothetical protein
MRVRWSLLFFIVLSPWTVGALPDRAWADVQAVMVCRQLPPGPGRADCLERATADLGREQAGQAAQSLVQEQKAHGVPQTGRAASRARFTAGVEAITYRDGRPVFRLDNGQTWYSTDRRRLTFKHGRNYATIEKTPVGMLLHYNGSFFALQVLPEQS